MIVLSTLSTEDLKAASFYLREKINETNKLQVLIKNKLKYINDPVFQYMITIINKKINKLNDIMDMLILYLKEIVAVPVKLDIRDLVILSFNFNELHDLQLYFINTNWLKNSTLELKNKITSLDILEFKWVNDLVIKPEIDENVVLQIINMDKYILFKCLFDGLEFNGLGKSFKTLKNLIITGSINYSNFDKLQNCNNFNYDLEKGCLEFINNNEKCGVFNFSASPISYSGNGNGNFHII